MPLTPERVIACHEVAIVGLTDLGDDQRFTRQGTRNIGLASPQFFEQSLIFTNRSSTNACPNPISRPLCRHSAPETEAKMSK
ncbi:MAG: hypothetical protein ACOYMW_02920 [Candidatus Competibacteraceae bacterium]